MSIYQLNGKNVLTQRHELYWYYSTLPQKMLFHTEMIHFRRSLEGPGCSKLTTLLVNVSLKFQMLISNRYADQYVLLKKCEKLLHCIAKASLIFSTKISVCLEIRC